MCLFGDLAFVKELLFEFGCELEIAFVFPAEVLVVAEASLYCLLLGGSCAPGCSDRVWRLRSDRRPKEAEQIVQVNGRFFWWTERMCRLRSDLRPNGVWQMSHWNFRVCSCTICMCFLRTPLRPND